MSSPSSIYCFHCRGAKPVKDLKSETTTFESRKAKKPMIRQTWVGCCNECGKRVRQFAKKETPKEEVKVPEVKTPAPTAAPAAPVPEVKVPEVSPTPVPK